MISVNERNHFISFLLLHEFALNSLLYVKKQDSKHIILYTILYCHLFSSSSFL